MWTFTKMAHSWLIFVRINEAEHSKFVLYGHLYQLCRLQKHLGWGKLQPARTGADELICNPHITNDAFMLSDPFRISREYDSLH